MKTQYRIQEWLCHTSLEYTPQKRVKFLFFSWWSDIIRYDFTFNCRGGVSTLEKAKELISKDIEREIALEKYNEKRLKLLKTNKHPRNIPYES